MRYRRLVWSIILQHHLSDEAREDVFQQVFAALVKHVASIREEGALVSWLATTCKRACWKAAERSKRDAKRVTSLDAAAVEPAELASAETAPSELAALDERQRVRNGLERLGGKCRELLETLFGSAGEPNYTVIAERLGIRVGSIGPTRARCLEKLADVLHAMGFPARTPQK